MAKDNKTLGKQQAVDVKIAVGLALHSLIDEKGLASMGQLLQGAANPAPAMAHAIYMILSQVRQQLHEKGINIDSRVWIANGGVLDQIISNLGAIVAGVIGFEQAASPEFGKQVKQETLKLMQEEDAQGKSGGMDSEQSEPAPDDEMQEGEPPQRGGLLAVGG